MNERRDPASSSEPISTGDDRTGRRTPLSAMVITDRVRKRVIASILAALVFLLLGWTVLGMADRVVRWLNGNPEYTLPFSAIELVPIPPEEIRLGREGILTHVKERAGIADPVFLLNQDLHELGLAFAKYSSWVEKVDRVERLYPGRLVVHVRYRVPVARVDIDKSRYLVIAADGVVIPSEEIRTSLGDHLIKLEGFRAISEASPGRFLGAGKDGQIAPEVMASVRLASFFSRNDGMKGMPGRIASINVSLFGSQRLMTRTRRKFWVHWNNAPGEEAEDEPKASEKLERLARWEDANPLVVPETDQSLIFTRDSIRLVTPTARED